MANISNEDGSCFVMISGCSGGGKSTLIEELARRGHAVVREPGRRIIAEVRDEGRGSLPWDDPAAFARRALAMSVADHGAARGLTFFDRGIVDATVAMVATRQRPPTEAMRNRRYDLVVIAPPWAQIYVNDEDRRHSFGTAIKDYGRVLQAYLDEGYEPVMLPRASVEVRADFAEAVALRHRTRAFASTAPGVPH